MWGRFQELRVVHGQQIIDREVALVGAERELQNLVSTIRCPDFAA